MLIRAAHVLPIRRKPVANGAVLIRGDRIEAVGSWKELRRGQTAPVIDLGDVALLPGLINAHCHLDYTEMAGLIPPRKKFIDWISAIVALKAQWTNADFAASWRTGAAMLLRSGTTTVADVEAVAELLPYVWNETPLRVYSFLEMINIRSRTSGESLVHRALLQARRLTTDVQRVGLSPHAPYTASADLFQAAAWAAREQNTLVMSHVAESESEFEMFTRGSGAMFDWLKPQRAMSDCGQGTPVQHLERLGAFSTNFIAVHANCLGPRDARTLAQHGTSVVHCPRTHAYFQRPPFPFAELQTAGVNLCLGTDSLASVLKPKGCALTLDLFAEMQQFAATQRGARPAEILELATVNGARALRREGQLGELTPGALADLIAIPIDSRVRNVPDAVLQHTGNVAASMIGGRWAIAPAGG